MEGHSASLGRDVRDKLAALGYLAREPREKSAGAEEPLAEAATEARYLIDGPGLHAYAMSAHEVSDFASGQNVSRRTRQACPRCGAWMEERIEWAPRALRSHNRLRKVRCCASCAWSAGF